MSLSAIFSSFQIVSILFVKTLLDNCETLPIYVQYKMSEHYHLLVWERTFVNFSDCFPITIISPCGALDHFSPLFVWKIILEAAIFIPDWYYDKLVTIPIYSIWPYKISIKDNEYIFSFCQLKTWQAQLKCFKTCFQHFWILVEHVCLIWAFAEELLMERKTKHFFLSFLTDGFYSIPLCMEEYIFLFIFNRQEET